MAGDQNSDAAQAWTRLDVLPGELLQVFADAYRTAALEGADMRGATSVLEGLRAVIAAGDGFRMWRSIDAEIGRAQQAALETCLLQLRSWFETRFVEQQTTRISTAAAEEQPKNWLHAFAMALVEWRPSLCRSLLANTGGIDPAEVSRLSRAVELMDQQRWMEAGLEVDFLTSDGRLPARARALVLWLLARIDLYQWNDEVRAGERLSNAQRLSPEEPRLLAAAAELALRTGARAEAEEKAQQAIQKQPDQPYAYNVMMKLCVARVDTPDPGKSESDREHDLFEADNWVQRAIRAASGYTETIYNALQFYGRPDKLAANEERIRWMMGKMVRLDPAEAYSSKTEVGAVYMQAGRRDEARALYREAAELNPAYPKAYLYEAYAWLDEKRYDEAKIAARTAIAKAPESFEGAQALINILFSQERWEELAAECEKAQTQWPEWWRFIVPTRAYALWASGKRDSAVQQIIEFLQKRPGDQALVGMLQSFVSELLNAGDTEAAIGIYNQTREAAGPGFSGSFQSQLGNVYYQRREYGRAVESYKQALDADPANATYLTVLADVYSETGDVEAALEQHKKAFELSRDEPAYHKAVSRVYNKAGIAAWNKGDTQTAIQQYRIALQNDDQDAVIWSNLALALTSQIADNKGEALTGAMDALRHAVKLNPGEKSYAERLRALETRERLVALIGDEGYTKPATNPLVIEVGLDLVRVFGGDGPYGFDNDAYEQIQILKSTIKERTAVPCPPIRVKDNLQLQPAGYRILFNGMPVAGGTARLDKWLATGRDFSTNSPDVAFEWAQTPGSGAPAIWIDPADAEKLGSEGIFYWNPVQYICLHVYTEFLQYGWQLIGHEEVGSLLTEAKNETCTRVRDDPQALSALVQVIRALTIEGCPAQPLESICATLLNALASGGNLTQVVAEIRQSPEVRAVLAAQTANSSVLALGPRFESLIAARTMPLRFEPILRMDLLECAQAIHVVQNALREAPMPNVILVNDPLIRPLVLNLAGGLRQITVMARTESSQGLNARIQATIEWPEDAPPAPPPALSSEEWALRFPLPAEPEPKVEIIECYLDLLGSTHPHLQAACRNRFQNELIVRVSQILHEQQLPAEQIATTLEAMLAVRAIAPFNSASSQVELGPAVGLLTHSSAESLDALEAEDYVEAVRVFFRTCINDRFAVNGILRAIALQPELEAQILTLGTSAARSFGARFASDFASIAKSETSAVVLTGGAVRRKLELILGNAGVAIPVIAYAEVTASARIEVLGHMAAATLPSPPPDSRGATREMEPSLSQSHTQA
jgi:flagellar biosynthesis component FlhA/Tfp pilus assembly protein PilF